LANEKLNGKIAKFISTLYSKNTPSTTKLLEFPNSSLVYSLLKGQGVIVSDEEAWPFSETPSKSETDSENASVSLQSIASPVISIH
jgi:hypothetical protein